MSTSDVPDTSGSSLSGTDTLHLDLEASVVAWKGTKMWGRGSHTGEVALAEGVLLLDRGQLTGGWFVVDMTSIAITDIPVHEREAIKNLTQHLEDPLFLDVETYPTARFELTEVQAVEPGFLLASGDLTVKDVTRAIQFPVTVRSRTYSTRFQIDRFDWNIAYAGGFGATRFADRNFVDELIELDITLVPR